MDVFEIQPGWTVCDSKGEEVGKVGSVDADGHTLSVTTKGLFGEKHHNVATSAVSAIEDGRVELSITRKEVEHTPA